MSPGWSWARGRAAPAAVSRVSAATRSRTTRSAMPTPVVISRAWAGMSTRCTVPWRESWGGATCWVAAGRTATAEARKRKRKVGRFTGVSLPRVQGRYPAGRPSVLAARDAEGEQAPQLVPEPHRMVPHENGQQAREESLQVESGELRTSDQGLLFPAGDGSQDARRAEVGVQPQCLLGVPRHAVEGRQIEGGQGDL